MCPVWVFSEVVPAPFLKRLSGFSYVADVAEPYLPDTAFS